MVDQNIEASGILAHGAYSEKGENAIKKLIMLLNTILSIDNFKPSIQFIMGGDYEDYKIPEYCIIRINTFANLILKLEDYLTH